jgi:hypothetical protein
MVVNRIIIGTIMVELKNLTAIELELSDTGLIVDPRLHDGLLTRVELLVNHEAALTIQDETGKMFNLVLQDLKLLKVTDFREGNTVLYVRLRKGPTCDETLLAELYFLTLEEAKQNQAFKNDLNRLRRSECVLLELQPSYGATVIALCREVMIYKTF